MLFQLIVPISLSFFLVMSFCNNVIWDTRRNWKCPNGQMHQLKNFLFLIISLRIFYCENGFFYRWNELLLLLFSFKDFLFLITIFRLSKKKKKKKK